MESSSIPSNSSAVRELPQGARILCVCLMAVMPVLYVLHAGLSGTGLTSLLHFGSYFHDRALPSVKACSPPVSSVAGYDGQFYAQVATDPLLLDPKLHDALDLPAYRATRIFLPWLAFLGGLGKPCAILDVFALLNLLFWFLLLFGLLRFLRPRTARDFLCVFAILMTAGVLFSLQRSLVDLPAATLAFYLASLTGSSAIVAGMMMLLTKETYLLALPALFGKPQNAPGDPRKLAMRLVLVLAPLALWYFYAHGKLGFIAKDAPNVSWPLAGVIDYVKRMGPPWVQHPGSVHAIANLLAPFSLLAQVGYLLWRRDTNSPYWRMGIGFGIAYLFLSPDVFVEQLSFTRDTIPLVIAFHIGLRKEPGWRFTPWFIAGNAGLYWGLWRTIEQSFR